jgi:hypothetical protein
MKTIKDSNSWSVSGISGKIDSVGSFTPEEFTQKTGTVGLYSYVRVVEKDKAITLQKVVTLINCDYAVKPEADVDLVLFNFKAHEVSTVIAVRKDGIQSDDADSIFKVYKHMYDLSIAPGRMLRLWGIYALIVAVPLMLTIVLGIAFFGIAMYCFYKSSQSKRMADEHFESLPSKEEIHKLINSYMNESAVSQPNSALA